MKKPRKDILNDDEVGCVTCARYKDRFFVSAVGDGRSGEALNKLMKI